MLVGAKRFALCYNISMPAIFAFRNGIYDGAQTVKSIYLYASQFRQRSLSSVYTWQFRTQRYMIKNINFPLGFWWIETAHVKSSSRYTFF
jgi:hypothetical protein